MAGKKYFAIFFILIFLGIPLISAVTIEQLMQNAYGNITYNVNTTYLNATGIQVLFEYSSDDISYHSGFLPGDQYFRTSSDGGSTWSSGILFVGPQGPQGIQGINGTPGEQGPQGIQGINGTPGPAGEAATIAVNYTFMGGINASVINVGNSSNALLDFTIPNSIQYPIGAVFVSTSSENPSISLGYGTWIQIAQGRTLFGQSDNLSWANTPGSTGGNYSQIIMIPE